MFPYCEMLGGGGEEFNLTMVAELQSTFNHPIRQEEARDAAPSDQKMDNYDHSTESNLASGNSGA